MAAPRTAPRFPPVGAGRLALACRRILASLLFAAAGFGASGCGEAVDRIATDPDRACEGRVWRIGAASSLREMALSAQRALAEAEPPLRIETTLGPSNVLARQLALGAPIDVLVSADPAIVERGIESGALRGGETHEIARGRLVLVAPPGSRLEGAGAEAIWMPGLGRVAVPPAAVPLGRYARAWLADRGALEALAGRIVATDSARATVSAVAQGHVSLAFVYESDRRLHPSLTVVHRPRSDALPPIRYVLAHATRAPVCPARDRIVATWTAAGMRARLQAAGFDPPRDRPTPPLGAAGKRT